MMHLFLHAMLAKHIFAFACSFFLGLYLVPVMIRAAKKLNLLDCPDGKIKNHKIPTPYLGGVAVYVSFIATLALVYPFAQQPLWFLLGTTLLLFVGLIDDFNVLTPLQKLGGQLFAVVCLLKGGFALKSRFFSDYINIAASAFWMLSVINAFNLVDVMDGLSSLLALVATASFIVMALLLKNYLLSLFLMPFFGALLAFFFYNKPPAKIYLGDAGSLFVGSFLAATPLLVHWTQELNTYRALPSFAQGNVFFETAISALVPILIIGVPLLEVTSLVVIRKYKKIPFYNGSPHHFASYLRRKGWSVVRVLAFAACCACFLSSLALLFMFGMISFLYLLLGLLLFGGVWFWVVFL